MALSDKQKKIRDVRLGDVSSQLADKIAMRDRALQRHQEELEKIQEKIDELTFLYDTFTAMK